ncbi:hypothetical protein ACQB6R_13350 [Propionibacteriaceae bacterium G1746]|uniref:hypothetical protein n=1 Tax=Aestuariimicrobium sp. G57 TaxID=3418485 RepID=UPI003C1BF800
MSTQDRDPVTGVTDEQYDRFAADPYASTRLPERDAAGTGHTRHGNHWMHVLMCLPMFLIVGYLIPTGSASLSALVFPVLCMIIMAAMMFFMNRSSETGHSRHSR